MFRILITTLMLIIGGNMAVADSSQSNATVVEIATLKLADGITPETFAPIDARVENEHVSKQPGFVARETGATDDGWVVIVHWASAEAAQASMDSFASAPAAAEFMSMIDASSISMTRYSLNK